MGTTYIVSKAPTPLSQNRWLRLAAVAALCGLGTTVPSIIRSFEAQPLLPLSLDSLVRPEELQLPVSLPNGTHIQPPQGRRGYSQLTIDNGNAVDAVAKLVDPTTGQVVRFVYVQAHNEVIIEGLDTGSYELRFALGLDWDQPQQRFRRQQSLMAFSKPLEFVREWEGEQDFWKTYKVTLHPVLNGTAQTEPIDESKF